MNAPNLATIKTAIDNLAKLRSDYDTHISQFGALRNNFNRTDDAVDKNLKKKIVKPDDIKTILDVIVAKLIEITAIDRQLGVINTDVTTIKDDLRRIKLQVEKVKIPHERFNNIVYTLRSGSFEWTPTNNILYINAAVNGIYRLTLVSRSQFNISSLSSSGINNMISTIIGKDATEPFTIHLLILI